MIGRRLRLMPLLACAAVPVALLVAGWPALVSGHPVHLVVLGAAAAIGCAVAWWARTKPWLTTLVSVSLLAPLIYLQPFEAATVNSESAS